MLKGKVRYECPECSSKVVRGTAEGMVCIRCNYKNIKSAFKVEDHTVGED